jgi:SNF2 family DNA or RNA helicase
LIAFAHLVYKTSVGTKALITAGSGGAGLNLTAASHVILCEPWWRDSDEQQVIGQAYRLSKELPVHVYKIYGVDSLVDEILTRLNSKKAVIINRIMEELRRPDEDQPTVPKQYKWDTGEY